MLFDDTLRALLEQACTVAIVGAKDKPDSPVDRVGRYLIEAGYRIVPVHPVRKTAWGLPVAASLCDLPGLGIEPDIICLFRASEFCAEHARETMTLPHRPLLFWMQEGIRSPEAGAVLGGSGIRIVEDLCLKIEHQRLFGSKTPFGGSSFGSGGRLSRVTATTAATVPARSETNPQVHDSSECAAEPPDPDKFFHCMRCGHCCEGQGGIVVGPVDLPRLAAFFGLSEPEFLARHTQMRCGKPVLTSGADGYCVFFQPGSGCSIHPARPNVCRAWPFFRGNLVDKDSFTMAQADCPGITRDVSHAAFARAGYAFLRGHDLLAHDPVCEGRALIVEEKDLPPDMPQAARKGGS